MTGANTNKYMKIFSVYYGGAGGSGHKVYLVKAKTNVEAIEIIKKNTFYPLGLQAFPVIFNKNISLVCDYDNPEYEG